MVPPVVPSPVVPLVVPGPVDAPPVVGAPVVSITEVALEVVVSCPVVTVGSVASLVVGAAVVPPDDVPLSGNLVIIDHGHGLSSSFLHLDKLKVKEGDVVKQGQVFATSGNSGRSTGPHLDWRMNLFDTRIDPQTVVEGTP